MDHNAVTTVNDAQIRKLLGGDQLKRLVERLQNRMSRGQALAGKIQLSRATPNERAAIDQLMGRLPTQGSSLTIDLDKLAATLAHAKACEHLEEAVVAICGPITDERSLSLSCEEKWERFWGTSRSRVECNLAASRWIDSLKGSGLLKRISGRDLHVAKALLSQAASIVEQVPYPAVRLAELAASVTGNSHALDRGQPLAALVIPFAPTR